MIDVNPAKLGVDNPSPRRREQRPFDSWAELDAVSANLSARYRPMVIFAASTGLRPAECRRRTSMVDAPGSRPRFRPGRPAWQRPLAPGGDSGQLFAQLHQPVLLGRIRAQHILGTAAVRGGRPPRGTRLFTPRERGGPLEDH